MKGNKYLLRLAASIAAMSLSSSAMAIMSAPYGWYLEGNVGSTTLTNKSYPGSAGTSGVGGSGNLGYKFMPYVAAEGNYTQYAATSVNNSAGTQAARDRHYSYALAVRGILPIADYGAELFGRLGAAQSRSKVSIKNSTAASALGIGSSSHSYIGLYWGGGISYYFMPELALNAQWARAQGSSSTGTMSLFSAGITFIFG